MEKEVKKILYLMNRRSEREMIPFQIYRCYRTYSYAYGKIRISRMRTRREQAEATGSLLLFYCMIPKRTEGGSLFSLKKRQLGWEQQMKNVFLAAERERLQIYFEGQEWIPEVLAAVLYLDFRRKDFSKFYLWLPEDYGFLTVEMIQNLLNPYLHLVNQMIFVGEGNEELEDFFFEEYGIPSQIVKPEKIEFGFDCTEQFPYGALNLSDSKKVAGNSVNHMQGFLDTVIKSSYNT